MKAFAHTSRYDGKIAHFLEDVYREEKGTGTTGEKDRFPINLQIELHRLIQLRYGENPHQQAALYEAPSWTDPGLAQSDLLQGKPLSFNNFLDLESARGIVSDFPETAVAIIKHTNPCGAATGGTVAEAYSAALEADPQSAYGGIVGSNRIITGEAAEIMSKIFLEAIVAPGYEPEALTILGKKKNLRLLVSETEPKTTHKQKVDLRSISGGFLLQDLDSVDQIVSEELEVVTKRRPTEEEYRSLSFGWRIIRHLKSNAVLFSSPNRLLSAGFGQTSRVEAVRLARQRCLLPLEGSALASDAFFPFRDGLDLAVEAGAKAVIQPGGSIRDEEVIAAADEQGVAMVFTGRRHFKH
jgi:phosphoribosylaminoimidazolecarboxamide formyltransferase/IMP cyclohydrolase